MSSGESSKKRKSFGGFGFLTAREFMDKDDNSNTAAAENNGDDDNNGKHEHSAVVAKDSAQHPTSSDGHVLPSSTLSSSSAVLLAPDQTSFTANLTVRGLQFYKENVQSIDIESTILLQRQPNNEHDENAIAAYNEAQQHIGHIAKEQAALLASFMDQTIIKLDTGLV